jgi:hypothetical protein
MIEMFNPKERAMFRSVQFRQNPAQGDAKCTLHDLVFKPARSNSDLNLGGKTSKFNPRDRVQKKKFKKSEKYLLFVLN